MRHNLPAPSQAWGTDIDKRIASLESRLRLAESQIGNTTNSISSLTSERAINGVAQPFVFRNTVNNIVMPDSSVSNNPIIWSYPISWGSAGSYMMVTVSGWVYLPLNSGAQVLPGDYTLRISISGSYHTISPLFVSRGNNLVGSFTHTIVISNSDNPTPVAQLELSGGRIIDNIASGHNNSYIDVNITGVRY